MDDDKEKVLGEIILYLGGAKSGKTKAALETCQTYPPPRFYLATAQALDDEMDKRIQNHRAERGPDWRTVEEPIDLCSALASIPSESPVLLDCLTLWFSNLMGQSPDSGLSDGPEGVLVLVDKLSQVALARGGPTIIVSNDVGGGIVPMDRVSRFFRDLSGLAHQRLAAEASKVFMVNAGLSWKLK
ncbi:MAG: bifunctional adenosylcobinamide kinase/adenosylcobinamide-phosphate guanylyltransferase [Deltaproteobacteria bacterium]|nr:bifunctional adenosylcobinamide kinase/adenosylcobinamide-phosphate guanylyltransferase [Deltaproteobacteria bacterium]